MSLTEQQLRAVTAAGSVAVTAGAGTGKTHMLTERYLYHLTEGGLRPLQVVAGTFTEAAAAELRGRVRARLRQLPGLAHLAAELEAAQIGTLHSLAGRICREHPDAAGVPWDMRVQDELEQRLWLDRNLRKALAELPLELPEQLPFDTFRAALQALLADPFTAAAALSVDDSEWPALIAAEKERAYRRISSQPGWREALRVLEGHSGPADDKLELQRRAALAAVARLDTGDFAAEACSTLDGLSRRPGGAKAWGDSLNPVKEACATLRDGYRSASYAFDLELGPADDTLRTLLAALSEAYRQVAEYLRGVKQAERLLDFNDLELHALRALEKAEVREFYRTRWQAFLVDEFQDTNPVQAELLARLTGLPLSGRRLPQPAGESLAPALLTVVGDEKQSIYGFRRADLGVFRQVRAAIREGGGEEVELSTSFRTHHELITPLNRTFAPALADLHQDLRGARTEAPGEAPFLRVQLVVGEEKVLKQFRQRAEAHAIGELVEKLLQAGAPVYDKVQDGLRPARPADIAILARTWDTLAAYGDELAARSIPTIHAGGGNLLAQREARDGLSLLRFVADPSDDLSLAALLRSPFFAMADRRLVELAAEARAQGSSWWEALAGHGAVGAASDPFSLREREQLPGAKEPGAPAVAAAVLASLLAHRGEAPSALLRRADELTGYTAVLSNLPGGKRRLADWRGFCDFVTELERGLEDVFAVVRELRLLTALDDVKVPRPGMEAADAVSLMSVHNAKGLEWPIVVVPDITAANSAPTAPILFEADAGVAFKVRDEADEKAEPALYTILKEHRKQREAEEELRVLYVALTRARDLVVLSGNEEKGGRLAMIAAGLVSAGVEPTLVPFDASHSVPKTPRPESVEAHGERLLGGVGAGLFELPVTSLSSYASCPRRFHFEQVLQHPGAGGAGAREEVSDGGSDLPTSEFPTGIGIAARIGELAHQALQCNVESEDELARFDPTLAPEHVRRALAFAVTFRRSPAFAPVRDRIVERELRLSIEGGQYGSTIRLGGIADAVGREFVLDYKTGRSEREAHLLQVAVYARALGLEQAFVAYLREDSLESFSAAELRSAGERVARILAGIEAGEFRARPERQKCARCPFEPICEASALRERERKAVQAT